MVVTGPSGSGKSTLIKNMLDLSGEEAPQEGHGPKPTTNQVGVHTIAIILLLCGQRHFISLRLCPSQNGRFVRSIIITLRERGGRVGERERERWGREGERLLNLPLVSLLVLLQLTPAESRELNKECSLLGFYDNHDIWHFLSAVGMFLAFLVSRLILHGHENNDCMVLSGVADVKRENLRSFIKEITYIIIINNYIIIFVTLHKFTIDNDYYQCVYIIIVMCIVIMNSTKLSMVTVHSHKFNGSTMYV
jgi:energy-coupling factor transporter ATP-binding protein EcfA2